MQTIFCTPFLLAFLVTITVSLGGKVCSASVTEDPLKNIPNAWSKICEKESDYNSRMSRFTGYLEGVFSIEVPNWWRHEGRTPFTSVQNHDKAELYGQYQHDKKSIGNGDTIEVSAEYDPTVILIQRTSPVSNRQWTTKLSSLSADYVIQGPIALDCAIVSAGDFCLVFARLGEIRILAVFDILTGKKMGQFTFLPAKEPSSK